MSIRRGLLLALIVVLLAACAPPGDPQAAHLTLIAFFDHLANDEYDQAVDLYGGDYAQLIVFNRDVDPANRAELWRMACYHSGLQCLQVASASLKTQTAEVYTFVVEFKKPDGSRFVLGPCCGATPTEMPPTSQFEYRVQKQPNGTFKVLDLPPYMP